MATADTNICELPSEKYYRTFDIVEVTDSSKLFCNNYEFQLPKLAALQEFCFKLISNLEALKKKEISDLEKHCSYLSFWTQDNVIDIFRGNSSIFYIIFFHKIWTEFIEANDQSKKDICSLKYYSIGADYISKWKNMHDYNNNYEYLKTEFYSKENCKENYCKYFIDIFNIHEEFKRVCNGTNIQRCPEFWNKFQTYYLANSDIELKCKDVYDKLGYYKVQMHLGENGIEEYIEQYESQHTFSFIERLIGYSVKNIISKILYYSRYIILPILLILLFYFFMKKLSLFGSKIAPKADDMRKMWRNVQGVTNPASLLNPMKPPGGGNKMSLSYLPK
ncbi:PIR protein [Plasmodium ovale]|uniref:PIR Superfamily Protein n=2 Tax=Plasmodium ovale TaxID=36330 RepID=A0A1A8WL73_PLAOA|nr:PIR Superfamily Protein [Plasmodium ovale curtisi]SBT83973.1 PIR protein [Plasmodium ovale]